MRLPVASATLAAAFILLPPPCGLAPAWSQDFSITNQVEPANAGRRDLLRQLQAWWDVHAYYPRHASANDEEGTVKLHLVIETDGQVSSVAVVQGSGSASLDATAASTFRDGFVRPFPKGMPKSEIDLLLRYVLLYRHDQPVPAGYTAAPPKRPFTITNEKLTSPILDTMLQRTCTGTVVKQGIRNHPMYGVRNWAQAVFFRKPDGTPWVKFYEGGYPILAPVTEVGRMVQWTGRAERRTGATSTYTQYTVWPDGENNLSGKVDILWDPDAVFNHDLNLGGTVDFTCETEVVPTPAWSAWFVTPGRPPPGDPP